MKGVDSSVLLGLLEGDAAVRSLLKHLRGLEVATTEADLLELAWLAGTGTKRERRHRLETLSRLRRRITVLPLDARATDQTVRIALRGESGGALPLSLGRLGHIELPRPGAAMTSYLKTGGGSSANLSVTPSVGRLPN